MKKKPKILKHLLATASTVAVLVGGAEMAMGANVSTTANAALSAGANWNPAAPADGDSITIGGAHAVTFDRANAKIAEIDLNKVAPGAGVITESVQIGNIYNGNGNFLKFNFNADAKTLTLSGNNYEALGRIDFANRTNSVVTILNNVKLNNGIDATTAAGGTVNINGNVEIVGELGATNALGKVRIAAGATLQAATDGNAINVDTFELAGADSVLEIGSNTNNVAFTSANALKTGILRLVGTQNIDINNGAAGTIGAAGNELAELRLDQTGNATFYTNALVKKVTVGAAGNNEFRAGMKADEVIFNADATITATNAGDLEATNGFKFGAHNGIIEYSVNGGNLKGDIITEGDGNLVTLKLTNSTAHGKIGSEGHRIEKIESDSNLANVTFNEVVFAKTIEIQDPNNSTIFEKEVNVGDNGTLKFTADGKATFKKDAALDLIDFGVNAGEVIIEDGATVTGHTHSTHGGGHKGVISFAKSGTFVGNIGSAAVNNKVTTVEVGANGSTSTLQGDHLYANEVKISGNGTANLDYKTIVSDLIFNADGVFNIKDRAEITGNITNGAADQGSVIFEKSAKLTGDIAAALQQLKSLTFKAGTVTVDGAVINSKSIVFDGDAVLHVSKGKANMTITSADGITATSNNSGTISTDIDLNLATKVGASGKALKAIHLTADKTIDLRAGAAGEVHSSFTTAKHNEGTLNVTGAVTKIVGDIGSETHAYKVVTAGAGADLSFSGNVYAKDFNTGGAHKITFDNSLNGDNFTFGHAATLILSDKGTLNTHVKTKAAGQGVVETAGDATILKGLGETAAQLQSIEFKGTNKTITVGSNLLANTVTTGQNTVVFTKDVTIGVAGAVANKVDVTKSTLDLGKNTVTSPIVLTGIGGNDTTIKLVRSSNANGLIDNSKVAAQDLTQTQVTIITDGTELITPTKFTIFKGGAGIKAPNKIESTNLFFTFTPAVDGNNIVVTPTQKNTVKQVLANTKSIISADLEVANVLDRHFTSATGNAAKEIGLIQNSKDAEQAAGYIAKITPNSSVTEAAINGAAHTASDVTNSANTVVNTRLAQAQGAAAGSNDAGLGAWVKGFYGKGTQKAHGNASGYKANIAGGTIGFDMNANENTTIGAAVSLVNSKAKHKGARFKGGKTDGKSILFNVYGIYDFGNSVFNQFNVNFGNTKVTNKVERNFGTATGKFDIMNYGLSTLFGYNMKAVEGIIATPMAGLSYSKYLAGGYTETGAGASVQNVSKKDFDKIVGTVGIRLAGNLNAGTDMSIAPEAHFFVNHDFRAKAPKDSFTIDGLGEVISVKGSKPAKTSFNFGVGLTAKSGNIEYGAGYDGEFRKKYSSHQGSVKVRVNF